jgi:hypothetical protein
MNVCSFIAIVGKMNSAERAEHERMVRHLCFNGRHYKIAQLIMASKTKNVSGDNHNTQLIQETNPPPQRAYSIYYYQMKSNIYIMYCENLSDLHKFFKNIFNSFFQAVF